ncbi:MAG: TonB-dependent receptor plug domain-containing protein, partial [Pseudomonadota bacterium]
MNRSLPRISAWLLVTAVVFTGSATAAETEAAPETADAFEELLGADTSTPAPTLAPAPEAQAAPASETAASAQDPAPTTEPEQSSPAAEAPLESIPVAKAASGAAANTTAGSDPRRIEEIVVTATKREQLLRDIPASITAISGEKLEDSGKMNLADYMQQTPGLTVNQAYPGLTRVTVRGISTDTNPASVTP